MTEQFGVRQNPVDILLGRLSFTHFVELLKIEPPLKRLFYETEAVVNNWSVRELQRAMESMLYERTGLSKDKEAVLEPQNRRNAACNTMMGAGKESKPNRHPSIRCVHRKIGW